MTLTIPQAKTHYATLLSACAPKLPSDNSVKNGFYQLLDDGLHCVPKNDKIFLLGDFNTRVGQNSNICSGVMDRHSVGQVNSLRLLTLCAVHDLALMNTLFQQKTKFKTFWIHPRSTASQEI